MNSNKYSCEYVTADYDSAKFKMKKDKTTAITITAILILAAATAFGGCGKSKTTDKEASQVIQLSVAPEEATPTPAPEQVDSAAVTTNGNLTMVNEYLAEQENSSASDTNTDTGSDAGTDNNDTTGESDGSDEQ